jgi:hypothetical protein
MPISPAFARTVGRSGTWRHSCARLEAFSRARTGGSYARLPAMAESLGHRAHALEGRIARESQRLHGRDGRFRAARAGRGGERDVGCSSRFCGPSVRHFQHLARERARARQKLRTSCPASSGPGSFHFRFSKPEGVGRVDSERYCEPRQDRPNSLKCSLKRPYAPADRSWTVAEEEVRRAHGGRAFVGGVDNRPDVM